MCKGGYLPALKSNAARTAGVIGFARQVSSQTQNTYLARNRGEYGVVRQSLAQYGVQYELQFYYLL